MVYADKTDTGMNEAKHSVSVKPAYLLNLLSPSSRCKSTSGSTVSPIQASFFRSRASSHVRPNKSRSFLTVEVHDTLKRPLFFLKSEGIQSIACCAILLESIRNTYVRHLSRRSLMTDFKVSCPVVSRTVLFVIMSFKIIFRIFLCHLWCAASSFFVLDTLMDHVSAPYNSVERTKASYKLIFICKLRPLSVHIFVNRPNTPLAFPNLALMSLSQLLLSCMMLPR